MVSEPTVQNMLNSESTIGQPAYEYIPEEAVAQSLESQARKLADLASNKHQTMRYHNRNTTEEEKEEFAIAGSVEWVEVKKRRFFYLIEDISIPTTTG